MLPGGALEGEEGAGREEEEEGEDSRQEGTPDPMKRGGHDGPGPRPALLWTVGSPAPVGAGPWEGGTMLSRRWGGGNGRCGRAPGALSWRPSADPSPCPPCDLSPR
ncbi:MAG: hypothetical protein AMXMBFR53_06660 [Gemmatimonadota bacterium]